MAQRKTSVGVYYAPASLFNSAVLLDEPEHRRTNQFAEIYAVGEAISTIHANENTEAGRTFAGLRTVVIVLDSKWVFQCLTEWIDSAWEVRDGSCYNKRANREIQNGEMISRVHNWIEIWRENCDVQVKFWWVNREWNKDADRLARSVLKRPFAPKKTRGRPHARKNRSGPPKPQDLDYPNELAISCYEDTSSPFRSDTPDPENLATDQPISIPSSGAPAVYTLPVHGEHIPRDNYIPFTVLG